MRRTNFLLLLLLGLFQVTNIHGVVKGDQITTYGKTYVVTKKRDAGNGHPAAYEVAFISSNLMTVNIPEEIQDTAKEHKWKVTAIMDNSRVPNATSVTIPNTVRTINANCLIGKKLTTIHIPESVTNIQNGAFAFTSSLTSITVETANPYYYSQDGVLYSKEDSGNKCLVAYPVARQGTDYHIPDGIVGIRPNALQWSQFLETVYLPSTLTELPAEDGYNGFTSALKLKAIQVDDANPKFSSVDGVILSKAKTELVVYPNAKDDDPYTIPSTVIKILEGAFGRVCNIKNIVMNPPLKEIGKEAFKDCVQLCSVSIPASITKIENGAFSGAYKVNSFHVDSENQVYKTDEKGVIYTLNGEELAHFPAGLKGTYETLPTTKKILEDAFKGAPKIEKVIFNSGLEEIEKDAFQYTTSLKDITFAAPATITKIGTFAFTGAALETLTLPSSLKSLEWSSFANCSKLQSVKIDNGTKLETLGREAFANCNSLESFTFEGNSYAETIGSNAFKGDSKLSSFTFPAKVKTIEEAAFNGCENLTSITFPTNAEITTIGKGAFQNALALTGIELPTSVTTIEESAFNSCQNLKEIKIPAQTNNISPQAFQFCGKLKSFTVDEANQTYSSVDGFLLSKDKHTLISFPPGKADTYYTLLPPTIERIGDYAFYYNKDLENITLPENVTSIGQYAFDKCAKLNTIAFLNKTPIQEVNIGHKAFNEENIDKSKIDISVRQDAYNSYNTNTFWNAFHQVISSFKTDKRYGATEYFILSKKAVMVVDVQSDVFTYVVPQKVQAPNIPNHNYEVRLWNDRAMANNNTNIQEVVFNSQLDYMGIDAFKNSNGTTTVTTLFFTGNPPKDMSSKKWDLGTAYSEFDNHIKKIYVKKTKVENYRSAIGWTDYANRVDYQIKDLKITHKYGTFSREFDTDLNDYFRTKGACKLAAFVASETGIVAGHADYNSNKADKIVVMRSIDGYGGVPNDYGYLPAETGTLLKILDIETLPNDYYYTIGEKDQNTYNITSNIMQTVTEKGRTITASTTPLYVLNANEGIFYRVPTSVDMPVHRAYALIPYTAGHTKVSFMFEGDEQLYSNPTSINNVQTNDFNNTPYYNLNGQRVEKLQRGVYIHQGKKVVVK